MKVIGLGAGGHARVLIEILQQKNNMDLVGLLDSDPQTTGRDVLGVPVLGDDRLLSDLIHQGIHHFFIGLGGAGNNKPRQRLFDRALAHGMEPVGVIHPQAIISPSACLGRGVVVMAGAVINTCARVGSNVIVNTSAVVEHDCILGDHVHVATGARLASGVEVGAGAHIGVGASVRQLIRIGPDVIVGAGAVVVDHIAAGLTVVGVPARPLD